MARFNKIFLGPVEETLPQVRELVASEDMLPGTFVVITGGEWALADADTVAKVWLVQDDYFVGTGVDVPIPAGDTAIGMELLVKNIFAARVADGAAILQGDPLTPQADGTVDVAVSGNFIVAYAEESYTNSTGSDQLIKVRPPLTSYLSVPVPPVAAFDPVNSDGTLSNGNTTVSAGTGFSLDTWSAGKHYVEFTLGAGVTNDGSAFLGVTINYAASSYVLYVSSGDVMDTFGNIGDFTAGDIIGVALDQTADKIWFRKNTGDWNDSPTDDPATATGGFAVPNVNLIAMAGLFSGPGSVTINPGPTFAHAKPAGFSDWAA